MHVRLVRLPAFQLAQGRTYYPPAQGNNQPCNLQLLNYYRKPEFFKQRTFPTQQRLGGHESVCGRVDYRLIVEHKRVNIPFNCVLQFVNKRQFGNRVPKFFRRIENRLVVNSIFCRKTGAIGKAFPKVIKGQGNDFLYHNKTAGNTNINLIDFVNFFGNHSVNFRAQHGNLISTELRTA